MRLFTALFCLIAAVLGAAAILVQSAPLNSIISEVALVWLLSNLLLSGAYKREYWKRQRLDMTMSQIYREAKAGRLPKTSALEQVMSLGMMILMGVSVYLSIVG